MRNRFRTLQIVLNLLGSMLMVLAVFLLIPIIIALATGEVFDNTISIFSFIVPSAISFVIGSLLRQFFRTGSPNTLQAMLICSLGWLFFSAISALPFVFVLNASYLDGFFESMSGFTTTGITMFTGLDLMPRSVLFWRSLTQWIGGLGILTFFLAVTYRGGSAHTLFGAESHKVGISRPVPGLANTLRILWIIYAGFTVLICTLLLVSGMSLFDSVCHGFTALATGGYSPHDASIGFYRLAHYANFRWIEYILIFGMLLGGTNFLIHYRLLHGDFKAFFDTREMKYWWSIILLFFMIIFVERFLKVAPVAGELGRGVPGWTVIEENIRTVLFQVVAVITTTGFVTKDFGSSYFGHVAMQLFLVMMVVGGCVGSTAGGIKIFRVTILFQLVKREVFKLRTPRRALSNVLIDGKPVDTDEIYRVSGLFFAWILLLILGGGITAFLSNHGVLASFSGMFSALGNIGPCYIAVGEMGQLNPVTKIVYIFGMLAGRLEILPVLLLFSGKAWRS